MTQAMTQAPLSGILVVTGTSTGVGKTIVTAAIAALASAGGRKVAVVKPAQTGVPGPGLPPPAGGGRPAGSDRADALVADAPEGSEVPDLDTVTRLSGVTDTHELARFPDPLSPEAAARVSGLPPVDMRAVASYIAKLATDRDLVLVEGAGGLLVRYDPAGSTLADLALTLGAPVLVVAAAGLGTLNHTALTCEAAAARGLARAGLVIGSWPRDPGLAEQQNLTDLPVAANVPLAGILPERAGALSREDFLRTARSALAPPLGGNASQGGDSVPPFRSP